MAVDCTLLPPNGFVPLAAGADEAAKLNLGVVVPVLVPPAGTAGALKLKDNGVEAGLAASLPRAPLKEDVGAAEAAAEAAGELSGLLEIPKSNFGFDVAPVKVVAAAAVGIEGACTVVFPNTDEDF